MIDMLKKMYPSILPRLGIIRWWNENRNFGLIESKSPDLRIERLFLHRNAILVSVPDDLAAFNGVLFEVPASDEVLKSFHHQRVANVVVFKTRFEAFEMLAKLAIELGKTDGGVK